VATNIYQSASSKKCHEKILLGSYFLDVPCNIPGERKLINFVFAAISGYLIIPF
jgi:hypothetical protein